MAIPGERDTVIDIMRELAGREQVGDTGDHKVPELQKVGQRTKYNRGRA